MRQRKKIMGEIRSISTTTVAPKNPIGSSTRTELTPWELRYLLIDPIQRGLLFRKQLPQDPYAIMDHLKNSLSRTLDLFYPLAGRLGTAVNYDDDTICFFINCNAAGVPFIHAVADGVTVRDILDPIYVPKEIVSSFFPMNGTQNYQGVSEPLLAVQATELEDAIFIGCTMNHVVADGTSFWHFFNSWAEICRGSSDNINIISQSPVFDREFVPHYFPIRIPQSALAFGGLPSPPTQETIFHFTKEKIAALKAKANEEKETNKISSLQALMSHIWRSIIRNRRLPEDQETTCTVPIGMRSRVHPPLSEHYFGAAVQGGTVTMKAGEVLELGLGHTAWQINRTISAFTSSHVSAIDFFESWAKNPNFISLGNVIMDKVVMGGSPRFNVYGADFGWGRPVAVRNGRGNNRVGRIAMCQGAEEGSIEIEACLSPETLQGMLEDAEFMDAVAVVPPFDFNSGA